MKDRALAQLKAAHGSRDPLAIGRAHLAVVAALAQEVEDNPAALNEANRQADLALQQLQNLEAPWELSQAHLAKATVTTDLAAATRNPAYRHSWAFHALDHCQRAVETLYQGELPPHLVSRQLLAAVVALLVRLRSLIESPAAAQAVDRLLEGLAEMLGQALGWEIRHGNQGLDLLTLAQSFRSLAQAQKEPAGRLSHLKAQRAAAGEAVRRLRLTRQREPARQAQALYDEADARLRGLGATLAREGAGIRRRP